MNFLDLRYKLRVGPPLATIKKWAKLYDKLIGQELATTQVQYIIINVTLLLEIDPAFLQLGCTDTSAVSSKCF